MAIFPLLLPPEFCTTAGPNWIYYRMIQDYEYSSENLEHMKEYTHFQGSYDDKAEYKYGQACKTYIRNEMVNIKTKIDFRYPFTYESSENYTI